MTSNNCSDEGLLSDGTKPLLEPMLTPDYLHASQCNFMVQRYAGKTFFFSCNSYICICWGKWVNFTIFAQILPNNDLNSEHLNLTLTLTSPWTPPTISSWSRRACKEIKKQHRKGIYTQMKKKMICEIDNTGTTGRNYYFTVYICEENILTC